MTLSIYNCIKQPLVYRYLYRFLSFYKKLSLCVCIDFVNISLRAEIQFNLALAPSESSTNSHSKDIIPAKMQRGPTLLFIKK